VVSRDLRRLTASHHQFAATGSGLDAMCKVLNKHKAGIAAGAVYIGRGSKWGNPFRIGPDGDRAAVIVKHERWLADQPHLLRALDELHGRDLVCFCAPLLCHGDVLRRLANAGRDERIAWWRAVKAT
jgi:hypothetical protein